MPEERSSIFKQPKIGDEVLGRVVYKSYNEILMDIGTKQEAVMPQREFGRSGSKAEVNQEFYVKVIGWDVTNERFVVSRRLCEQKEIWDWLEGARKREEPVEGKIISQVNKGFLVDIGIKAFLPQSQIDAKKEHFSSLVGSKIRVLIREVEPRQGRVVVSQIALLEKEREEMKRKRFEEIQPGQIYEGTVTRILGYGLFVNLDGVEGLLHRSEMSYDRFFDHRKHYHPGDRIKVYVLSKDADNHRLQLSLKPLMTDPWVEFLKKFSVGDVIKGPVRNIIESGIFVQIIPGVEGFVHISDLSDRPLKHPSDAVSLGEEISAKIVEIHQGTRKVRLSKKAAEYSSEAWKEYTESVEGKVLLGEFFTRADDSRRNRRHRKR
ncbi:MAG: 30S ribosomal protein S1 [bacterium JZ-2024 1]